MYQIKILKATNDNLSDVCNIMERVSNDISDKAFFYVDDRNFVSQHINEKGFILIATLNEIVTGFLMIRIPKSEEDNLGLDMKFPEDQWDFVAHIESVAVLPEYRGNGIQKGLLIKAETILNKRGFRYLMATVYPENHASLTNFLSSGYKIVLTKQKYGGVMRHILLKRI